MTSSLRAIFSTALGSWAAVAFWSPQALADCALMLSNPTIDFGVLKRDNLAWHAGKVLLGERSLSLNLTCTEPTELTLYLRAHAADDDTFRLSTLGHYRVRLRDAVLDGASVALGELGRLGEVPVHAQNSMHWRPERGLVAMRDGRPVQGKVLQARLDVVAVAPRQALRVRDETLWEALASIDVPQAHVSEAMTLSSTVLPVSCEPLLGANGRVDFGQRSVGEFSRYQETRLPAQTVALTVACDGPALIALRMVDNRAGSATLGADNSFGLGLDRGRRVGRYTLRLEDVRVDGWSATYATQTGSMGASWSAAQADGVELSTGVWSGFSARRGATSGPDDLQHLSATLSVAPVIAPIIELDVSEPVLLDGSATIEIVYL
jgi:hypothetical protein